MKKFVAGIVVGALLFGGSSVLADSVKSLMGAKVTGIYTVEQNGKKIAEAAVINGSTYAPVRAIAEATGTPLKVEGKTIVLESNPEGNALSEEEIQVVNKANRLKGDVLSWQSLIVAENEAAKTLESKIAEEKAAADKVPGRLEALETNLQKSRDYVAELQSKIDAANAEIAQLQAQLGK